MPPKLIYTSTAFPCSVFCISILSISIQLLLLILLLLLQLLLIILLPLLTQLLSWLLTPNTLFDAVTTSRLLSFRTVPVFLFSFRTVLAFLPSMAECSLTHSYFQCWIKQSRLFVLKKTEKIMTLQLLGLHRKVGPTLPIRKVLDSCEKTRKPSWL